MIYFKCLFFYTHIIVRIVINEFDSKFKHVFCNILVIFVFLHQSTTIDRKLFSQTIINIFCDNDDNHVVIILNAS